MTAPAVRRPAAARAHGRSGAVPQEGEGLARRVTPRTRARPPSCRSSSFATRAWPAPSRARRRGRRAIAGFLSARTHMVTRRPITARVADDNAQGRLADMDPRGATSTHHSRPMGVRCAGARFPPHAGRCVEPITVTWEYCAANPRRLKSMVLAPATDPRRAHGDQKSRRTNWVRPCGPVPRGCRWTIPTGTDLGGGERGGSCRYSTTLHHREPYFPGLSRRLGDRP